LQDARTILRGMRHENAPRYLDRPLKVVCNEVQGGLEFLFLSAVIRPVNTGWHTSDCIVGDAIVRGKDFAVRWSVTLPTCFVSAFSFVNAFEYCSLARLSHSTICTPKVLPSYDNGPLKKAISHHGWHNTPLSQVARAADASVVAIASYVGTDPNNPVPQIVGTGVCVDGKGWILTNRHVLNAACPDYGLLSSQVAVLTRPRTNHERCSFEMRKVVRAVFLTKMSGGAVGELDDEERDIAFLQIEGPCPRPARIGSDAELTAVGEGVFVMGYPCGASFLTRDCKLRQVDPFLQKATISAVRETGEYVRQLVLDIQVHGGSSGSPVFFSDRPAIAGLISHRYVVREPVDSGQPTNPPANSLSVQVSSPLCLAVSAATCMRGLARIKETYRGA